MVASPEPPKIKYWIESWASQLGHHSSIDNIGQFVMYVGGSRSPGGNLRCQRESPSLSHEEWVWPGSEPTTSVVTGADVNFEHRSYHCATPPAQNHLKLLILVLKIAARWRRSKLRFWPPFDSLPDIGSPLQRWWRRHVGCYDHHVGCYATTGSAAAASGETMENRELQSA
jgi:hypothetical protein